jgi:hypothetical protein
MNFSEAMSVYLSDDTYENVCNDSFPTAIKLIGDRGTKRFFKSDGTSIELTIDQIVDEGWYVLRNQ